MKKAKILIAEDDPRIVIGLEDQLENMGHQFIIARNGKEALEKVEEDIPDLIVLDVMMPEMDGYQVCERLKSSPETKHIPILMLTAKGQLLDKIEGFNRGADDYLSKPYDKAEFESRVTALLKRSESSPFNTNQNHTVFSTTCKPEHHLNIQLKGEIRFNDTSEGNLQLKIDEYSRDADNTCKHDDWRYQCKKTGKLLFQKLFTEHPESFSMYNHALGAIKKDEDLHFRFDADRDFLRVPLEFLYADSEYFVLKYPMARANNSVRIKKKPLFPETFNTLWTENKPLRILLIASDTPRNIPGVDHEVENLKNTVKTFFEDKGIPVRLKAIHTEQATYETVRKELRDCNYQIIHYAGHGRHDITSPEKSSLYFWEKPNQQGKVIQMPASELKMLLKNSDVRFVYLSCCLGTTTGESSKLLDDDFLGIADSLIQAGIPSVLGFRWSVFDDSAITLSHEFYQSLADKGQIDTALLHARCEIAAKNRDDITWVSPILIMQD